MSKKSKIAPATTEGLPLQSALRGPRICFERIIPESLDPEAHVPRALRNEMIAVARSVRTISADEVAHKSRMSAVTSKK